MAEQRIPTTLGEWLDDLTVRFLLNLPSSELSSVPRLCFQVEEAQWFYEDFIRPAVAASGAPPLPSLPLRQFFLVLFQHCPLLSGFTDTQHIAAYEDFLAYKIRIPVRGAILLDQTMEKVLLVRGWKKSASWSFPRGKINKDEKDLDCAIREVYEETGYDLHASGLVPSDEKDAVFLDVTMREQHLRLFVFRGVPEDTYFEPKTRKEISKIQWYNIRDLPGYKKNKGHGHVDASDMAQANKFYMVAPFLGQLKRWIGQQRRRDNADAQLAQTINGIPRGLVTEDETEFDEQGGSVDLKSEELKNLLNIGSSTMPAVAPVHAPDTENAHMSSLLAMLQGAPQSESENASLMHNPHKISTPQEAAPYQRSTNNLTSMGQFQSTNPHAAQLQDLFFRGSDNSAGIAGRPAVDYLSDPRYTQPGSAVQQIGQQRQFVNNGSLEFQHIPSVSPNMPLSAQQPSGPLGPAATVPSASQLPPPKLNAHAVKLLDAFKPGATISKSVSPKAERAKGSNHHQMALLDLFKKPGTSDRPAQTEANEAPSALSIPAIPSHTTEGAVHPPLEKRPTLNEITRTLPLQPRRNSTSPSPAADHPISPTSTGSPTGHRTGSKELLDLLKTNNTNQPPSDGQAQKQVLAPTSPIKILQPNRAKEEAAPQIARPTPSIVSKGKKSDKSAPSGRASQPITILARPGSSRGPQSPNLASPLRNGSSTSVSTPQLLQKSKDSNAALSSKDVNASTQKTDKRDQLLALFAKAPSPKSVQTKPAVSIEQTPTQDKQIPTAAANIASPPQLNRASSNDRRDHLLGLLTPSTQSSVPVATDPPSATRLETEQRNIHQAAPKPPMSTNTSQSMLLDLFRKPSNATPIVGVSASTSPFIPSTATTNHLPQPQTGSLFLPQTIGSPLSDSSIGGGSLTSPPSATPHNGPAISRKGSQTPKETRDFLLGFLNNVVQREGRRASEQQGGF